MWGCLSHLKFLPTPLVMWVPVSLGEQLMRQLTWVVRLGHSKATVYCKVALATLQYVYMCVSWFMSVVI